MTKSGFDALGLSTIICHLIFYHPDF